LAENPQARKIFNKLARVAEEWHIPAYNEDQGTGVLRHAIVRIGWKTNECLLVIVTSHCDFRHKKEFFYALRKTCPEVTSAVQNINDRKTNAMLGRQSYVVWGTGTMHDKLLGCLFEIGPQSFYQTNPAQTEALYQRAIEATGLRERSRLLDAYCGTGTIGICAASMLKRHKQTIQVVGIDQTPDAIACARRNARINALQTSCRFVRTDATAYIKAACRGNTSSHFDAVILDPPRAGSTPDFLESVSLLAPQRVIYVSCNVKTQLRDLDILRARGYRVTRILPVDMFPHTKHVECIAALSHVRAEG
jgi:23S rRNA (uracil-5-)-methyltransferase RumA